MGGYGALRYSLAHPDLFGASIVLSPAVYVPIPPSDSSTREFGAFGLGKSLFVDSVYKKLNYPALFPSFSATGLPLPMFIAVGDDEFKNPDPKDASHDLDFEAHVLFNQAVRVPNLTAELRVVDGGHDWDVWGPTFVEGAKYIFQFLNQTPVTPMKATLIGTAQEERAGGVATDAAGNVYQALAAGGSVAGQPYAGDKDLVLVKDSPTGTRLWTRELGIDPARAGVRRRDRPGRQCRRHRLHERRLRRCPRRQHHRRRLRRQVRPERESHLAAPVRRRGRGRPRLRARDRREPETST